MIRFFPDFWQYLENTSFSSLKAKQEFQKFLEQKENEVYSLVISELANHPEKIEAIKRKVMKKNISYLEKISEKKILRIYLPFYECRKTIFYQ